MKTEMPLIKKIRKLFQYRQLPYLIQASGLEVSFIEVLIPLQKKIYLLDKYLEYQWVIDTSQIDNKWQEIELELERLGYLPQFIPELLSSFKIYLDRELDIRKDKFPSDISIEEFYLHKSCDVKLHRQIIADRAKFKPFVHQDWHTFDLITEINDDIDDIQEDADSYNGNRLLFTLNLSTLNNALNEYRTYLYTLGKRCQYIENEYIKTLSTSELKMALKKLKHLEYTYDSLRNSLRINYL